MRVQQLTCSIGAELSGVSLADAARDAALFAEIKSLLLAHKVLFCAARRFRARTTWRSRGASANWKTIR